MTPPPHVLKRIAEELATKAGAHIDSIRTNEPLDEDRLWHLLATCVLSSQVPYDMALAAADELIAAGYPWRGSGQLAVERERSINAVLCRPLAPSNRRYRFPTSRAKWLAAAVEVVQAQFGSLTALLDSEADMRRLRRLLIASIPGMGPKQASMFMRDSRTSMDVAVIDRHIIRFMSVVDGWKVAASALSSASTYERYEERLRSYSGVWAVSLGAADLAIWATARAAALRIE